MQRTVTRSRAGQRRGWRRRTIATALTDATSSTLAAWAAEQHPAWCATIVPGCGTHNAAVADLDAGTADDPHIVVGALLDDSTRTARVEIVFDDTISEKVSPALARKLAAALIEAADLADNPGDCWQFTADQTAAIRTGALAGADEFKAAVRARLVGGAA